MTLPVLPTPGTGTTRTQDQLRRIVDFTSSATPSCRSFESTQNPHSIIIITSVSLHPSKLFTRRPRPSRSLTVRSSPYKQRVPTTEPGTLVYKTLETRGGEEVGYFPLGVRSWDLRSSTGGPVVDRSQPLRRPVGPGDGVGRSTLDTGRDVGR